MQLTITVALAPRKIAVNNIGPGATDTDLNAPAINDPPTCARVLSEIPLGRVGQPSAVAGLAAHLASDAAASITGSTSFIGGGMLRQSGSLIGRR